VPEKAMTHAGDASEKGSTPKDQVLGSLHGWAEPDADGRPDGSSGADAGNGTVAALELENDQLREAIDSRAVIEQAKGVLILRYGLDEDRAFAVLRRWSQDSNTKLHTIADVLVNTVCRDDPQPPTDPEVARWLEDRVRGFPEENPGL